MTSPFGVKVGLALGGGAARGLAHIGVLRALERAGIPIDVIVGTSIGAVVGGSYAADRDIDGLEARFRALLTSEEFRKNRLSFLRETRRRRGGLFFSVASLVKKGLVLGMSSLRTSFISAERFAAHVAALIPESRIEDGAIPFGAVALDLDSGREIVLREGCLRTAASASAAIPGLLPPVSIDGRPLIDGGWIDKLPVLPAFWMGADVVIAVDISPELEEPRAYRRGMDVMVRANAIKDARMVEMLRELADVVIQPDVRRVHWADFGQFEQCIRKGEEETTRRIPEIRQALRSARLFSFIRPRRARRLADLLLESGNLAVGQD